MNKEQIRLKEIVDIIAKHDLLRDKSPQNIRKMIEELGPTFIKMGQILSLRADLLSKQYIDELKKLRCSVEPMTYQEIKEILASEYKDVNEIFSTINETPIGSASIAQTHIGKLKNGTEVAIKIQRKNIKEKMQLDAELLTKAISILQLNKVFGNVVDLKGIIDEMLKTAKEEMNFLTEANNIEIFNKNNNEIQYLHPLKIYKEISTEHVLVMENVKGCFINEKDLLKEMGYDLEEIAIKLANNYIKQAIDDGYFHADPHSDNIKIYNGKIAYLDFGMMGHLSKTNKQLLNKCLIAIFQNDISELAHSLVNLNTNNITIDYPKLKNDITKILEKNKATEISNINIKDFTTELLTLLRTNNISLPKDITMLIRGIVVMEGVLEEIYPNINLLQVIRNRLKEIDMIDKENIEQVLLKGVKTVNDLISIPSETLNLLKGLNNGELRFNIEMNDSKNQLKNFSNLFHQAIIAILDISFIIGISIMTMTSKTTYPTIFYIYVILALVLTIWLIIKICQKKD